MPATQASSTKDSERQGKPFLYIVLGLLVVVICGIAAKIISVRRNRIRQRLAAGDGAQPSPPPSRPKKRPECHEIRLSSASNGSRWQNILPMSAETVLPSPPPPVRDKSPSRWSLVKDIHSNQHSLTHQNSPRPSTTSHQPCISHLRPYEKPAGRDRQIGDDHSGQLQVAVLLAMPAPHPPHSESTPQTSMRADTEQRGVVPDVCVGVTRIPFKTEENRTRTNDLRHNIRPPEPSTARRGRYFHPFVSIVQRGHPPNT